MQPHKIRLERIIRMFTSEMLGFLKKDYDKGCRIVLIKDVELPMIPRVKDIIDTEPGIMIFAADQIIIPEMSADPDKKVIARQKIDIDGKKDTSLKEMMSEIKTSHEQAGWKITFMAESWKEILGVETAATAAN